MEHPVFTASISKFNLPLFERLINSILVLPENAKQTLYSWWSRFESEYFSRIVSIFISFLTYLITVFYRNLNWIFGLSLESSWRQISIPNCETYFRSVYDYVFSLSLIQLDKINVGKSIIPYEKFYLNPSFSKSLNLVRQFLSFEFIRLHLGKWVPNLEFAECFVYLSQLSFLSSIGMLHDSAVLRTLLNFAGDENGFHSHRHFVKPILQLYALAFGSLHGHQRPSRSSRGGKCWMTWPTKIFSLSCRIHCANWRKQIQGAFIRN